MARIRSAKPDFWTDPLMCALSRDVRFTFKGIWEVCADDHGRFLADVRVIKGQVWPLDDDISLRKVERYLSVLADHGRILLYSLHGVRYGYVVNWQKHQKVSHPSPSRFPDPPSGNSRESFGNGSGNPLERFASDSVLSGAERIREERNRAERSGAEEDGAEWIPPSTRTAPEDSRESDEPNFGPPDPDIAIGDEDRAAPPAPLVQQRGELPADAERFLDQLYSLATEKRRLDVRRQLCDALEPTGRGARLRRGVHVKARDPSHLAACCRAVLEDPPRQVDAAIVIVLEKLQDPPPGPTPAERHKATTDAAVAEEDEYHRASRRAGVEWAKAHPAEYEPIVAAIDREFSASSPNPFGKLARDAALTSRCAKAAGFPDFATWQTDRDSRGTRSRDVVPSQFAAGGVR